MMSPLRRLRHRIMVISRARAPLIWLRHRGLDNSDVLLASYPRSGNTWLRFILAEVLSGSASDFVAINRIIPEMGLQLLAHGVLPHNGRLIKTHEQFRPQYKKAIYIVRDIRAVALSNYARECAEGTLFMTFDEYLPLFLAGKTIGFGSWSRHVQSWRKSPLMSEKAMIIVRYEDLRRDIFGEVSRLLAFLGCNFDSLRIRTCIENSSLDRMRAKEDSARDRRRIHDNVGRFVRTGSTGGWKDKLTPHHLRLIEDAAGDTLREMGYPLAVDPALTLTAPSE
jgi:estrone sulfotransferase